MTKRKEESIQIKHSMHWIRSIFLNVTFMQFLLCFHFFPPLLLGMALSRKKGKNLVVYLRETMMVFLKTKNKWTKSISKSRKIDWSQCILTRHWRIFFIYFFLFLLFLCSRMPYIAKGCSQSTYFSQGSLEFLFTFLNHLLSMFDSEECWKRGEKLHKINKKM